MTSELRINFADNLAEIDCHVTQLFAMVTDGLAAATEALLSGDRECGRAIVEKDQVVDQLYRRVEELTLREVIFSGSEETDLRYLLSVLRIVPELERSGDLVEHVAIRAGSGLSAELPPRVCGLIQEMGRVGVEQWKMAANAYAESGAGGDAAAARRLELLDDEMDEMHISLTAELASGSVSLPVAMQMTLVGRFYERLGDHAVNIARRMDLRSPFPPGRTPG